MQIQFLEEDIFLSLGTVKYVNRTKHKQKYNLYKEWCANAWKLNKEKCWTWQNEGYSEEEIHWKAAVDLRRLMGASKI
jgi:hypothetical protein